MPGGFIGDPDIMDTWATSSLSPQIVCGWERDPDLFARTFPMDMRPQAHEIIRTWLFSTVVRSHYEFGVAALAHRRDLRLRPRPRPQEDVEVEGQRRRRRSTCSSSYGSDAVRWRAASARPGTDSPFDEAQMKIGRRLAIKILNASKFVLGLGRVRGPGRRSPSRSTGRCWPPLAGVVRRATSALDAYNYTAALEATETFFWTFCDDYLELVKERAYGGRGEAAGRVGQGHADDGAVGAAAAVRAVPAVRDRGGLVVVAGRLGAPLGVADGRGARAVADGVEAALLRDTSVVLTRVRKAKSEAKTSMRTDVAVASVSGPQEALDRVALATDDLKATGHIAELRLSPSDGPLRVVVAI